jgi:hypothetical protein
MAQAYHDPAGLEQLLQTPGAPASGQVLETERWW